MNWRRVGHVVRKEFTQLRRDRHMLRLVLITPLFQLFLFGYAVTTDIRDVATALLDEDRTASSRELAEAFTRSPYFDLVEILGAPREIDRVMDSGSARLVLRIPRGFAGDLDTGRTAAVQVILDGTDSMSAAMISGYAAGVVQRHSGKIAAERVDRLRERIARIPSVEGQVRVWYNQDLKSVNYMVPGVLSLILLIVTMVLTSMAIVKEREIGTLEQLVVTPLGAGELMAGKTIPFIVIGVLDMILVLALAVFWFRVPVAGSVALLFALSSAFFLTTLGAGLFISTVSYTQQQAMMTSFFLILPSILLSGFIFPIENMPRFIQPVTYLIPLRYYLVIIRGIFLKGNGMAELWPQFAVLLASGAAILALSAARFQKRLG